MLASIMKLVQRRPRGKDSALIPAFQGISNCVRSSSSRSSSSSRGSIRRRSSSSRRSSSRSSKSSSSSWRRSSRSSSSFKNASNWWWLSLHFCETFNFQFLSILFVNSFIFERGHLKKVPDCSWLCSRLYYWQNNQTQVTALLSTPKDFLRNSLLPAWLPVGICYLHKEFCTLNSAPL